MKNNHDQMMDFDVLMTKSNGHMETQFIYKRMALPKDSVDVDGLTLTLYIDGTLWMVNIHMKPAQCFPRQRATNIMRTRIFAYSGKLASFLRRTLIVCVYISGGYL